MDRGEADFTAVVVAAGSGRRFGGEIPKQFRNLAGRPVLERSVRALSCAAGVRGVLVVLPADQVRAEWGDRARAWPGVLAVVEGGATRAGSVRRGLDAVDGGQFVLVHDAARPLVPVEVVQRVIDGTRRVGAAVPALPVPDTVKRVGVGDRVEGTIDRAGLRLAQTPQGARIDWLRQALEQAESTDHEATDEAMALELAGHPVVLVPGDPRNVKITTAEDLREAERRMEDGSMDFRVGSGFDIHRVSPGRELVLGGVKFPGEMGLDGHSDADVVLHAAMDAVLGAACLGDIGHLFPPDDPAYAGADSAGLARQVADLVSRAGYAVVNLDLTFLGERPKIRAYSDEMRQSIAECFGVEPDRVGLKATTLERLGALGRGEGMACSAVALLRRVETSR